MKLPDGHTYTITENTSVFIAHRNDGKVAFWWSDLYKTMIFFAWSAAELTDRVNGPDFFGNRVVWANNKDEALALWNAEP